MNHSSHPSAWQQGISLGVLNLLFLFVFPAAGTVYGPWWILTRGGNGSAHPAAWLALLMIASGIGLYLSCVWAFACAGQGTPAPWDAPRRIVVVGPYRMVRNPIYIAAFLVIAGEAWLFLSGIILVYLLVLTIGVHAYVLAVEEPALRRRFGEEYETYRRTVPRWLPK